MTIYHMETDIVRGLASQLQSAAEEIQSQLQSLMSSAQSIDWIGENRNQFEAEFQSWSSAIQGQIESGRTLARRVDREVQEWEEVCNNSRLGPYKMDLNFLQPLFSIGTGYVTAGVLGTAAAMHQGQVLGVNSFDSALYLETFRQMSWAKKFSEEKIIQVKVMALQKKIAEGQAGDISDGKIAALDQQILELEGRRSIAEKNASDLLNRILPDKIPPKGNDGDGFPLWRSRTDDFEDEVANYDRQLEPLYQQRNAFALQRQTLLNNQAELADLQRQQRALQTVVSEGIPSDGPTNSSLISKLGGCTHYVAEKRDVSAWPNAQGEPGHPQNAEKWNDQALQAGYEGGDRPVKGAIIVFEAGYDPDGSGPKKAIGSAGHVGYVESVTKLDSGYKIEYSHANTIYNSDGTFVKNAHMMNKNSTMLVPEDDISGFSFIYDKR